MKKKEKEIYISNYMESVIEAALYDKDELKKEKAKKKIARTFFDRDLRKADEFLKLCDKDEMQALLEEIAYWDSPAGDIYHMWKYYDYCLPLLNEYTEKTGYTIRWKAYNEKYGLPVPEDDVSVWVDGYGFQTDPITSLCFKLNDAGKLTVDLPPEDAPKNIKPGEKIVIKIAGKKFTGTIFEEDKKTQWNDPEIETDEKDMYDEIPFN